MQQRHVMHFARVARLDDQRAARAQPVPHQVMVHAGRRQQARNRRAARALTPRSDRIRMVVPSRTAVARAAAQLVHRALQPGAAVVRIEEHRQRASTWNPRAADVPQLRQLVVVDDRIRDLDLPARLGRRLQQVALGADRRLHRRDELLANRVERRIGDLREELREVVVEQARALRQHGERRVGAHRPDRLLALPRHRPEQQLRDPRPCSRTPAAAGAPSRSRAAAVPARRGRSSMSTRCSASHSPYGCSAASSSLISSSATMRPCAVSTRNMRPGCSRSLTQHVRRRDVEHADLGRHDDEVVLRDAVARRPQAVAIEHGADQRAVGERDGRRAVPGLHERRVVLVERLRARRSCSRGRPTAPESSSESRAAAIARP